MGETRTREEMRASVGQEIGVSRWFPIDQARIDAFAEATEDHQYIHTDPERAKDSHFGTTIAHGFLTLSLLSAMMYDGAPSVEGSKMGVNYGFDKIRFLSPVRCGQRVRARFVLTDWREARPDEATNVWKVTVDIDGEDKPALVADWIGRQYF